MTCQDDLLLVIGEIVADRPDGTFWLYEVFERLCIGEAAHSVTTVRAVLTQQLCVNALYPGAGPGRLVERLARGRYRVLDGSAVSAGGM